MPRVAQPGRLSGKMRVRYTASRKLALLASAKRIMEEEGVSLRRAAERLQVDNSLIVRWQQQQAADPILEMLKCRLKAHHPGPLGQLKSLEDALLRHVFEKREQGINVHPLDLVVKASSLSPDFNGKHFIARCSAVRRFMRAHSLVYRMGTKHSAGPTTLLRKHRSTWISCASSSRAPIVTGGSS